MVQMAQMTQIYYKTLRGVHFGGVVVELILSVNAEEQ